jgi:ribosomal-protein-alanine N-acetyltransferase
MKHDYILETERLILRCPSPDDADMAFVWLSDPKVNRFMPYDLYKSVDEARAWLTSVNTEESDEIHFAFVRKEDNLVIGTGSIGPRKKDSPLWEFGYNLRSDCWNKGYATEAAKAMIRFAHETFRIHEFGANHAVDNPASGRVIEHCGLVYDHDTEYSTFDGSETFKAKAYRMHLD